MRTLQNLKSLVDMANSNASYIRRQANQTDALNDLIAEADVVWGIWQDISVEHGVDALLIKGADRLMMISHTRRAEELKVTAISCREAAEAQAMNRVFGDGKALRS